MLDSFGTMTPFRRSDRAESKEVHAQDQECPTPKVSASSRRKHHSLRPIAIPANEWRKYASLLNSSIIRFAFVCLSFHAFHNS